MISTSNLSVQFGKRVLFDEVNTSFKKGNCYGIIGANGSGKSTFLKVLSGKLNPNSGIVSIEPGKRMSVLEQNHSAYDDFQVLQSTLMGNKELYDIKNEMDQLYSKEDFNDNDGVRVGELQDRYEELNGWNAESDAASLLSQLGVSEDQHYLNMSDLDGKTKVRVLIAQSLFGNPDILIMDEPTNELDFETIKWLENFLINYDNTVIVVSHDRHFLDTVCTHISDIDFGKITHYTGNYTFWYESSQLALKQRAQHLYSKDSKISTKFYEVINGLISSEGSFSWGSTIKTSYLPLNNDHYFNQNINLVDWLRQWSVTEEEREEVFIRGFLGKMLFSGEEALKSCKVLSGGEKVRCILSKMMMERSNFLMLDEPTNHLDLETIQTLNNSLIKFKGNLILSTHDFEFANSVGNRIIEIGPNGFIDKLMSFEDYLNDKKVEELRNKIY